MTKKILALIFIFALMIPSVCFGAVSGYAYVRTISCDNTKVDSDLTDFISYVTLDSDNFNFNHVRGDGNDIVITDTSDEIIPTYDIKVDVLNQECIFLIEKSITAASATTIRVHYGKTTAYTTERSSTGLFDTNYIHYFAMDDTDGTPKYDSKSLWLQKYRLWYDNGLNKTFFVYIKSSTKDIMILYYDHALKRWCNPVKVADAPLDNAHCAPSVCVDTNDYIWVGWTTYDNDSPATYPAYVVRGASPRSIASWGSPETVTTTTMYAAAYISLIPFAGGEIVAFWRGNADSIIYRSCRSTEGVWSSKESIITNVDSGAGNDRPYWNIAWNPTTERVHVAWHQNDAANAINYDIYYMYCDNADSATTSTWKNISGDSISLPASIGSAYRVYDTSETQYDQTYLVGIDIDSSDNPHIVAFCDDATGTDDATDTLLHMEYTSTWNTHGIVSSAYLRQYDTSVGDGDVHVSGTDTVEVLISLDNASGGTDLKEYRTTDGGDNWGLLRSYTSNATDSNTVACYPFNVNSECRVFWLNQTEANEGWANAHKIYYAGSYTNYQPVLMDILGDDTCQTKSVIDLVGTQNGVKYAACNPSHTTGAVNLGQAFDASNDYISVADPDELLGATALTITFAVKWDTDTTNFERLIDWMYNTGSTPNYYYSRIRHHNTADTLGWLIYGSEGGSSTTCETTGYAYDKTDGMCYFACVFTGGTSMKIYEGAGVEVGSNTSSIPAAINSTDRNVPLVFGAENSSAGYSNFLFDGTLDEISIQTTARSQAWVKATYYSQTDSLWTVGEEQSNIIIPIFMHYYNQLRSQ